MGNFQARARSVLQSLGSTPLEWPKCKEHLRKSKDSEGPGGCGEFSAAVLQSLGSTPLEWPKCKENLRKSKDSEGPDGCGEFSMAFKRSVAKPRFDPP